MFHDQVRQLLRPHVPPTKLEDAASRLANSLCGIGLLEQFLRQPDIEEVYVRHGEVAIERGGRLERGVVYAPDAYWEALVKRVADQRGQAISPRHRAVLVDLPTGERFTGLLPPLSDGPAINIRRYGTKEMGLEELRSSGRFPATQTTPFGQPGGYSRSCWYASVWRLCRKVRWNDFLPGWWPPRPATS